MTDAALPDLNKTAKAYAAPKQKVPAFARYEGTSAWRKDRRRVREYAMFRAAAKQPHSGAAPDQPE